LSTTRWRKLERSSAAAPNRGALGNTVSSSPQVRGPPRVHEMLVRVHGLIPAGAGTTKKDQATMGVNTAHPRRCGDHYIALKFSVTQPGSSPQVRGPLGCLSPFRGHLGLIPVGAGTTEFAVHVHDAPPAHPRRCGDHSITRNSTPSKTGSSPQVRGPRSQNLLAFHAQRLIPAGAGTTSCP